MVAYTERPVTGLTNCITTPCKRGFLVMERIERVANIGLAEMPRRGQVVSSAALMTDKVRL